MEAGKKKRQTHEQNWHRKENEDVPPKKQNN